MKPMPDPAWRHVRLEPDTKGWKVVTRRLGSVIGWQTLAAAKAGPNTRLTKKNAQALAETLEAWIEGQTTSKR